MTTALLLVLPALVPLGFTRQAAAGEHYVVGVENIAFLPAYSGENGRYSGFARELFDLYAQEAGIEFTYRPLPLQRLMSSFKTGDVDFKFPDDARWQPADRQAMADQGLTIVYSDPVIFHVDGTLVRPGSALAADQIASLGTVAGSSPWGWSGRVTAGTIKVMENGDFAALVRQTLAGRVDAAYASIANVNYTLDHILGQPGALVFDPMLPHDDGGYLLSTIRHPARIADFNAWMVRNKSRIAAMKHASGVEKGVTE